MYPSSLKILHRIHQDTCTHEFCFHRVLCQNKLEHQHVCNVSYLVFRFCCYLGLEQDQAFRYAQAGFFHDAGKTIIPTSILSKPGPLTPEEWQLLKQHPEAGYTILKNSPSPRLRDVAEVALYHHERWDGSGYPFGLAGEDIPLAARIVTICDIYEALTGKRAYRNSSTHEQAMQIMLQGDGRTQPSHFDPDLLAFFQEKAELIVQDSIDLKLVDNPKITIQQPA